MIQSLLGSARTPVIYSNVPWASQMVKLWDQEVNDVAGWMPLLTFAGSLAFTLCEYPLRKGPRSSHIFDSIL